jgi:hypothetical protein
LSGRLRNQVPFAGLRWFAHNELFLRLDPANALSHIANATLYATEPFSEGDELTLDAYKAPLEISNGGRAGPGHRLSSRSV